MNNHPFFIERIFNATAEQVWLAISDKEQMKRWYFDLASFEPTPGFEFEFSGGPDGRVYLHICKVIEAIPNKKLSYSWKYAGYEGNSIVTFQLFEEANKTTLRLTHEGLETFPISNPDLAKENFVAGWTSLIGQSLTNYMEKISETKNGQ